MAVRPSGHQAPAYGCWKGPSSGPPFPWTLRVGGMCQAHQWELSCAGGARSRAAGFEVWVWYLGQVTSSVSTAVFFRVEWG